MNHEAPWVGLITLDQIMELHRIGILEHGGPPLYVQPSTADCVDGKLGSAWNSEIYRSEELGAMPGLCFAGHLLFYLAKAQCFTDGNKRIAWSAAMAVLATLGLTVQASDEEAVDLVLDIANNRVESGADVVIWMANRLEAPDDVFFN